MKGKFDVKKLWKRNQIMITALALMIAIARKTDIFIQTFYLRIVFRISIRNIKCRIFIIYRLNVGQSILHYAGMKRLYSRKEKTFRERRYLQTMYRLLH